MPQSLTVSGTRAPRRAARRLSPLERQVAKDLKRGLTTGSRAYNEAMREAKRLYDLTQRIDAELDATRKTMDGRFIYRADGSPRHRARSA